MQVQTPIPEEAVNLPSSSPALDILRSAISAINTLPPSTINAMLNVAEINNPLMPDKAGFLKGILMMLSVDLSLGIASIEQVSVNQLKLVALALGVRIDGTREELLGRLHQTAVRGVPSPAHIHVHLGPGPNRSPAGQAPPPAPRTVTQAPAGAPPQTAPPSTSVDVARLNKEFAEGRITREQYSTQWAALFAITKARKAGRPVQRMVMPQGPPNYPQQPGPHCHPPRQSHPAFSAPLLEKVDFKPTPGHIPLFMDQEDVCPHLQRGAKAHPPGPRWNEHPPQPFREPPKVGEGVIPDLPPPPPPRLMTFTAPPLTSGRPYSPKDGERAMKYTYDFEANKWSRQAVRVRLDLYPCQEGTMRHVFFMKDFSQPYGPLQDFVAKISKDPLEPPETYFQDCEMQALAGHYAQEYCQFSPPKPVQYLPAAVIECLDRKSPVPGGRVLFSVEPFLDGMFVKYTNNFGWVNPQLPRHTPQAFSHFTWCHSRGSILVTDIQGVTDAQGIDRYTDPQVLSAGGMRFGKADLSCMGIRKFFETHRCNDACRALNLPDSMCIEFRPPERLPLEPPSFGPPPSLEPPGDLPQPGLPIAASAPQAHAPPTEEGMPPSVVERFEEKRTLLPLTAALRALPIAHSLPQPGASPSLRATLWRLQDRAGDGARPRRRVPMPKVGDSAKGLQLPPSASVPVHCTPACVPGYFTPCAPIFIPAAVAAQEAEDPPPEGPPGPRGPQEPAP